MDYRGIIQSDAHDIDDHHIPGYGTPTRTRTIRTQMARTDGQVKPANLILKAIPADIYRILEPSLKTVSLGKEQFLYQEEDRLNYVYFPETAVVSEFKILEDGRMVEVAVTGKEGAIGLPTLMSDSHVARIVHRSRRPARQNVSTPRRLKRYCAPTTGFACR